MFCSVDSGLKQNRRKAGKMNVRSGGQGYGIAKKPPQVGDYYTADLRAKGNLRVKRRDPWHRANAQPKVVADPVLNGQDAEVITDVS